MADTTETAPYTMADFRKQCIDRLEYALKHKEPGIERRPLLNGVIAESFETPAGLVIKRIGSVLLVECDFGDPDGEETREIRIEFVDGEEYPVAVNEFVENDKGADSKTFARSEQPALAEELARYITLIP